MSIGQVAKRAVGSDEERLMRRLDQMIPTVSPAQYAKAAAAVARTAQEQGWPREDEPNGKPGLDSVLLMLGLGQDANVNAVMERHGVITEEIRMNRNVPRAR